MSALQKPTRPSGPHNESYNKSNIDNESTRSHPQFPSTGWSPGTFFSVQQQQSGAKVSDVTTSHHQDGIFPAEELQTPPLSTFTLKPRTLFPLHTLTELKEHKNQEGNLDNKNELRSVQPPPLSTSTPDEDCLLFSLHVTKTTAGGLLSPSRNKNSLPASPLPFIFGIGDILFTELNEHKNVPESKRRPLTNRPAEGVQSERVNLDLSAHPLQGQAGAPLGSSSPRHVSQYTQSDACRRGSRNSESSCGPNQTATRRGRRRIPTVRPRTRNRPAKACPYCRNSKMRCSASKDGNFPCDRCKKGGRAHLCRRARIGEKLSARDVPRAERETKRRKR
mmetsp:Transcript_12002/g.29532  ORF Transcript_12002/g.29532 Transcript_12002/m.29532 type:complete len:335 (-) Transcript_12002:204-1208(-)